MDDGGELGRKKDSEWISASFTTTTDIVDGHYPSTISSESLREWQQQQLLLNPSNRHIIAQCIPDACHRVWNDRLNLPTQSTLSVTLLNTPPPSPYGKDDESGNDICEELSGMARISMSQVGPAHTSGFFASFLSHCLSRLQMTGSHLIVALCLLQRLRQAIDRANQGKGGLGSQGSNADLQAFVFCLMLSNKICEDRAYDNRTWAHLTSYSISIVNKMEARVMIMLGHRLIIHKEELDGVFWGLQDRYGWIRVMQLSEQGVQERRRSAFTL